MPIRARRSRKRCHWFDGEHAELLFGAGDRLLPALASAPELHRRGVQIVAPLSGLALSADNVWFTRADYQAELDAAVKQLRDYGLTRVSALEGHVNSRRLRPAAARRGRPSWKRDRFACGYHWIAARRPPRAASWRNGLAP
ncbi:hypothetical protein ACTMU2_00495 [Cupriavidus basilensis]